MKISVVTAAYEAAGTIAETMRSVADQSWPDVEHLVIDGASSDGTGALAKAHLRPGGRYLCEADRGLYEAMNKGIALAGGDIIGILNADDIYAAPDVLERVAGAFEANPVDAVLGDVGFFRPGAPERVFRRYNSRRFRPDRLGWGWMPAHPAMFVRREVYERFGPYRTDYRIAADFEFIARAFGPGATAYAFLPEILVLMRSGGASTAGLGASLTIQRETLRACRENGIYSNRFMLACKVPLKLVEYLR